MGYIDTYRNTAFVDFLELIGAVTVPSNFQPQDLQKETASTSELTCSKSTLNEKILDEEASVCGDLESAPAENENAVVPIHGDDHGGHSRGLVRSTSRQSNFDIDTFRDEISAVLPSLSRGQSAVTHKEAYDPFLVDWNGPDDPENPQNWPMAKKTIMIAQVMVLTMLTYMGSSIYTPGQQQIQDEFHVGHVVGTLNLSLFVLGYGFGPLIFSPLSEQAKLGRLYLYIVTLTLFVILQIPAALTPNIGGLIVVRFLTGVFCSPSISTGGATLGDFVSPHNLPYFIGMWAIGACAAPALAPILGAAMVVAQGWRLIFWLLLAMCGAGLIAFIFFFPETLPKNILHRRAARIRKETGDDRYYTLGEHEENAQSTSEFIKEALYRPFALILSEPGVLAIDLYIGLVYACFYLFFEAFPIVFIGIYHFTLVEFGVAFLGFTIGSFFAYSVLVVFIRKVAAPRFADDTFVPEHFLILAMWVCFLFPASIFLFGWTAQVHWILPVIWEILFIVGAFNLFQSAFAYLSTNYPRYIASVFAGNAFVRSVMASVFPLFGAAMYNNLGSPRFPVGWGSSLVGFIALAISALPFILYKIGPKIRGRSKYAN